MPHSIVEIVRALRDALEGEPSIDRLREVRATIDDPAFGREVVEVARMINEPDTGDVLRRSMVDLQRACEEIATRREGDLRRIGLMGIGGGAGLATGGILAAVAIAVPAVALLPFAGGVYMLIRYGLADRQIGEEIGLCRQIAEEIKIVRGRLP